MKRLDQRGGLDVWIVLFVVCFLLLVSTAGFGVWAFLSRQDYKYHTDAKINKAVDIAKIQEDSVQQKIFVEKEKQPFKAYQGPATYGSILIQYPKTWSGFVTETDSTGSPIDGYFHPNIVPGIQSGTAFALRIQVLNQPYNNVMQTFGENSRSGKITIGAYRAPKVPSVLGARVEGEINPGQKDSMVVFPIRDKTLQISTQSFQFINDFNDNILANLTFSP
ncbi:MAG: hypothetical protein NVS1B7_5720 [Candidatus Saccharimonadales bacterium]